MILVELIAGLAVTAAAIAIFLAVSLFVGKTAQWTLGGTEKFEYGPLMPGMIIVLTSPIWGTVLYTAFQFVVGLGGIVI